LGQHQPVDLKYGSKFARERGRNSARATASLGFNLIRR